MNTNYFSIFQHLDGFSAGLTRKQTFHTGNDAVFKIKTFCDINILFKIINTRQAFINEIDRSAGMPDWLQVKVFFNGMYRTDFRNGIFCFR